MVMRWSLETRGTKRACRGADPRMPSQRSHQPGRWDANGKPNNPSASRKRKTRHTATLSRLCPRTLHKRKMLVLRGVISCANDTPRAAALRGSRSARAEVAAEAAAAPRKRRLLLVLRPAGTDTAEAQSTGKPESSPPCALTAARGLRQCKGCCSARMLRSAPPKGAEKCERVIKSQNALHAEAAGDASKAPGTPNKVEKHIARCGTAPTMTFCACAKAAESTRIGRPPAY